MIRNPTYRGVVQPWHCDQMGHMNVMHYVGKFDEASWNFFSEVGLTMERMTRDHIGVAAVEQNLSYKRELFPGDTIEVRSHVIEVRDKALRFAHEMLHLESGEVAATSSYTVVHMSHETRKAAPLPDDVREKLEAALKED